MPNFSGHDSHPTTENSTTYSPRASAAPLENLTPSPQMNTEPIFAASQSPASSHGSQPMVSQLIPLLRLNPLNLTLQLAPLNLTLPLIPLNLSPSFSHAGLLDFVPQFKILF
nr:hypothetical protein Itr_chr06CG20320 [Ipomoea trifida]